MLPLSGPRPVPGITPGAGRVLDLYIINFT